MDTNTINPEMEMIIMNIIVQSGSARSSAMEAIASAKNKDFDEAQKKIEEAGDAITEAHHIQTNLIQKEARGEKTEMGLLMVHAQDHLMCATVVIDMAKEFVALYEKMDR